MAVMIEGKEVTKADLIRWVLFIPARANGDRSHPGCRRGILIGVRKKMAMVLYTDNKKAVATPGGLLVFEDE